MSKRPPPKRLDESAALTDAEIAAAKANPPKLGEATMAALVRKPGRPALAPSARKQLVSIRLSPDVLEALRGGGEGWQTRADDMLREALGLGERSGPVAGQVADVGEAPIVRSAPKAYGGGPPVSSKAPRSAGATLFERMANLSRAGTALDDEGPEVPHDASGQKRA